MIRKTLIILSLIGVLLSVGLWGASCCGLGIESVRSVGYEKSVGLSHDEVTHLYIIDGVVCGGRVLPGPSLGDTFTIWVFGSRARHSWKYSDVRLMYSDLASQRWLPAWRPDGFGLPVYLLVLAFSAPCVFLVFLPFHRRRKRKKLGLCVKCGYDLRASKERCPECGEGIEKL